MKRLLSGLAVLLFLSACSDEAILSETDALPDGEWEFNQVFRTEMTVTDTLTPHDFYFLLRNGANYRFSNINIYFKTFYPNNTYIVDTIDCPLAYESGEWRGSGLGDMLDNEILFKTKHQFPMTGDYKFEIQHAMRMDTVQEIYDVGLRIEHSSR